MPQFISLEISAEQIADLMHEDGNFADEVWSELANHINMGAMLDGASDLASNMRAEKAAFISAQFEALSKAIKSGFNMANVNQI